MKYKEFIETRLLEASQIALDGYGKVIPRLKDEKNMQVLTDADLAIGQYLIEQIKGEFPEHNIINEESGVIDNNSQFTWTIDPVDGTSNYASKLPMYGIMIGLIENDEPIAGGIVLPSFNELYFGQKDLGSFCNGQKLSVSANSELKRNFLTYLLSSHVPSKDQLATELQNLSSLVPEIMSLRTSNSTAFDGAMTASGRYGVALNTTSYIWDVAPLQIIIEEAGGIFTTYNGHRVDYSRPTTKANIYFDFCAGSRDLHSQVQEIIKPI